VAAFGAFVDLGVHQDGLVHVSQLAHKFVSDAREVVKTGQIVKVQVVEVDVARKRIALTMKIGTPAKFQSGHSGQSAPSGQDRHRPAASAYRNPPSAPQNTAMASAFARLKP
jgi:protein Tex